MEVNRKVAALGVALVAALIAGAYVAGEWRGARQAAAPVAPAVPPQPPVGLAGNLANAAAPAAPAAATSVPAGHPPVNQDREGKVKVDAAQAFTHFRVGNKNVKSIHVDGKVVWVGTSGGVVRYDTTTDDYKLYDARNGLLSNGIFHVGKLRDRIVVGTYGGGMSLFDEKTQTWETYNVPEGLGDAFVYDVLETAQGDVWIATWSGVNRVRGGELKDRSRWELHTVKSTGGGLPNDWVYGLAEGRNGEIWLATEGGVARYRDGKWENWNHPRGLGAPYAKVKDNIAYKNDPSQSSSHHAQQKREMGLGNVDVAYNPNYVVAMEVAPDGTLWAGTWGAGLAHFDGRRWTNYTTAEGLPGNHVFMLHVDRHRRLWIGTNNGLALMKGRKFDVLTVNDGLFANNVFSMASAADGGYWIGSFGGVAHLRKVPEKFAPPR